MMRCKKHNLDLYVDRVFNAYCVQCVRDAMEKYLLALPKEELDSYNDKIIDSTTRDSSIEYDPLLDDVV